VLEFAWRKAKSNGGAAGVDGVMFVEIESQGLKEWILELQEDLRAGR
jgi:hypothetical protein